MRYVSTLLFIVAMIAFAFPASARKAKLLEGATEPLKGVKKMNVRFEYDSLTVGSDEIPAADYVKERTEKLNEKEGGKGSTWARAWVSDRKMRFEPAFKKAFKDQCEIMLADAPGEQYTLIFKSMNVEPGYNVGVSRKSARLSGQAWIVETANPSHVICKIEVEDCPGSMGGFDFDNGERIKVSYMVAGDMIGKFIDKNRD